MKAWLIDYWPAVVAAPFVLGALLEAYLTLCGWIAERRHVKRVQGSRPLRVECGWCHTEISPGREPVSHGICEDCARDQLLKEGLTSEAVEKIIQSAAEERARHGRNGGVASV